MREGSVPGFCPWLVDGHFSPVSSDHLSVSVCIQIFFSYKDASPIRLVPLTNTLILFNYLFKDLIFSKYSHIVRFWELRIQHVNFGVVGEGHNSAYNCERMEKCLCKDPVSGIRAVVGKAL